MPTMPNFVDLTVEDAKTARTAAGFSGGTYTGNGNGHSPGTKLVVSQTPAAGSSQSASVDINVHTDSTNAWWLSTGAIVWSN